MNDRKIEALHQLGEWIRSEPPALELAQLKSQRDNPWFVIPEQKKALLAIADSFLKRENLQQWLAQYRPVSSGQTKDIGIIMAGNLPLVGFHDWLCVFLSGHRAKVKLSSKDAHLLPALLHRLHEIDEQFSVATECVEKLAGIDAVIATGSNNSNRYFEYYFGHLPHIFRGHRNSIAFLDGDTSDRDIEKLGADVFDYFGLGCRSVSLCLVPTAFDRKRFFETWTEYGYLRDHSKWDNNFRYNYATFMMNQEQFLTDEIFILRENESLTSRIACLHIWEYESEREAAEFLLDRKSEIQVCVGSKNMGTELPFVSFGEAQQPGLSDYADHIDTMTFLMNL